MIILDIETTGQNPLTHAVVSMGALDFENPKNQFYSECRIEYATAVDPIALQINGFTEQQINDPTKKSAGELVQAFLKWAGTIEDQTIGGHNVYFDVAFLNKVFERYGLAQLFPERANVPYAFFGIKQALGAKIVDLHSLTFATLLQKKIKPPLKNNLSALRTDEIFTLLGLPPEPKPHHGLMGAKMEAEAFSRVINGKSLLEEFQHHPIPEFLQH